MNWITELGLNKDKQELKNEKHHRRGKCSMLCIPGKRALNGRTHLGTGQREVPSYSLFLIICMPSEVSRCAAHRWMMLKHLEHLHLPWVGVQGKSTLQLPRAMRCSGHSSSVCRATVTQFRLSELWFHILDLPHPSAEPPGAHGCSSLWAAGAAGQHQLPAQGRGGSLQDTETENL